MTGVEALAAMLLRATVRPDQPPTAPVDEYPTGRIDELWLSQAGRQAREASDDDLRARIVDEGGRVYHQPVLLLEVVP